MNSFRKAINEIYDRLLDEESRKVFDARIDYLLTNDEDAFLNRIYHTDDVWKCRHVENALNKNESDSIIIYGCGRYGKRSKKVLELCGYKVSCFVDSDRQKWGTEVDGIRVISVNEMIKYPNSIIIVVGLPVYQNQMLKTLVEKGIQTERIVIPIGGYLYATRGKQYFDVFEPQEDEVYVDAGTFDGGTVTWFEEWTEDSYKKVFAMEPLPDMFEHIQKDFKDKEKIELCNCAAWNQEETLFFTDNSSGSTVKEGGSLQVQAKAIDDLVKDEKVTYIKMDIEGSELKALEGAKDTIKKNKPRLAISIYHKPLDVIEIPEYILELVPEYKFYVRHYCTNRWETVLYAVLDE